MASWLIVINDSHLNDLFDMGSEGSARDYETRRHVRMTSPCLAGDGGVENTCWFFSLSLVAIIFVQHLYRNVIVVAISERPVMSNSQCLTAKHSDLITFRANDPHTEVVLNLSTVLSTSTMFCVNHERVLLH